ncbi:hypothetical protein GDO86_012250, partial [Hymenochirus boettgeri]
AETGNVQCFSCIDRNDGGCLKNRVGTVTCNPDEKCAETITTIETSHNQTNILTKGCGDGRLENTLEDFTFHGINAYIRSSQCNGSFCNTNLKTDQNESSDTEYSNPNGVQCYSCIGNRGGECSTLKASVVNCYSKYRFCFDGNVTLTIGNFSAVIPLKSCSRTSRCPVQMFSSNEVTLKIKGACCEGNLCNQDLSNKTQYTDLSPLVPLDELVTKNTSISSTSVPEMS